MENRLKLIHNLNTAINKVKNFSTPNFNNVFSRQYSEDIIFNMLNSKNTNYAFIFGDFNKLRTINELYGHEYGTKIMQIALNLIKKDLPQNSIMFRIGGDEFGFIIFDKTEKDCKQYIEKINNTLKDNASSISGISIELVATDSSKGDINTQINLANDQINKIKSSRKQIDTPVQFSSESFIPLGIPSNISDEEKKSWTSINNHINTLTYNFLQDLRPSKKFVFEKEQIKDASHFIIDSICALVNEKTSDKEFQKSDYDIPEGYDIKYNLNLKYNISPDTAQLIHRLITEPNSVHLDILSDDAIKKLTNKINSLTEDLIIDHKSGFFNKSYLKSFLIPELRKYDTDLYASFITTSEIKLSNSAYGYDFTDYRIDKTNKLFKNFISRNLKYNNNSFDANPNTTHIVSYGAGNFVLIYPKDLKDEIEKNVSETISQINSISDIHDPYSSLKISYAPVSEKDNNKINKNSDTDFVYSIKSINDMADFNKDSLKKELFNSNDVLLAFKKLVAPLLDSYLELPDAKTDITKKRILIENFHKALLNYEVLHNTTRHGKKTHGDIPNISPSEDFEK